MKQPLVFYLAHRGKIRKEVRQLQRWLECTFHGKIKLIHPYYDLNQRLKGQRLVNQDLGAVERADGVIAVGADLYKPNAEPFNQGGIVEYYHGYTLGKVVYIITRKEYNHPFVCSFATKMFKSMNEFVQFLKQELKE